MVARGARVDDRDGHAGAAGDAPGAGGVDVGVGQAGRDPHGLAGVLEAPQIGHEGVERERGAGADGLGPDHGGVGAQLGQRALAIAVGGDDDVDARETQDAAGRPHVGAGAHLGALVRRELDDQRAGRGIIRARRHRGGGAREDGDEQGRRLHAFAGCIGSGVPVP
jgi:hypothetical protein